MIVKYMNLIFKTRLIFYFIYLLFKRFIISGISKFITHISIYYAYLNEKKTLKCFNKTK